MILRGEALIEQRRNHEGIKRLEEGLIAHSAARLKLARPSFLACLADGYMETGRLEDAAGVLDEALAAIDENGDRQEEPERHRFKGKLLLKRNDSDADEAQICFQRAMRSRGSRPPSHSS
jgi:tetratricopeptide (TPR) repeat protein